MSEGFQLYDKRTVTLSVQNVADRLHQDIYGPSSQHSGLHSCPCWHLAAWYLGFTEKPKMYWPDGKGGNAWERDKAVKDAYAAGRVEAAIAQAALAAELLKCVAAGRVKINEDEEDDAESIAYAHGRNDSLTAAEAVIRARLAELKVEVGE